jgi:hypothetical protein
VVSTGSNIAGARPRPAMGRDLDRRWGATRRLIPGD